MKQNSQKKISFNLHEVSPSNFHEFWHVFLTIIYEENLKSSSFSMQSNFHFAQKSFCIRKIMFKYSRGSTTALFSYLPLVVQKNIPQLQDGVHYRTVTNFLQKFLTSELQTRVLSYGLPVLLIWLAYIISYGKW